MKKIIAIFILMTLLLSALFSCKEKNTDAAVFYYSYDDTYVSDLRMELESELKDAKLSYKNYNAKGNQKTQNEQIDKAISKGVSALIVNIVETGNDEAAKSIVEKAKAADIPLVFFNRPVSKDVVKSYDKCVMVGTDYEMAGHMQGEMIGNFVANNFSEIDINGDGVISYCLFKGENNNAVAEARTKYAIEDANKILAANKLPALSFYDATNYDGFIINMEAPWSKSSAKEYMKSILEGFNEEKGNMVELIIANNDDMAVGAILSLVANSYNVKGGKFIPVFGIDATDEALEMIEDGIMTGTVQQDAEDMAQTISAVCVNLISGNDIFSGIDKNIVSDGWKINLPYTTYIKEKK